MSGRVRSGSECVLAIETSQREGGIALWRREVVQEAPIGPPDPDRDQLLPAIDGAFRAMSASPGELSAVVVSCGPGGFTGLRVAVAAAKALAMATGCKLVSLPSAVVAARTVHDDAAGLRSVREAHTVLVALAGKGVDAWITQVEAVGAVEVAESVDAAGAATPWHRVKHAGLMDGVAFEALARGSGSGVLIADAFLPEDIAERAERLGLVRAPLRLSARACLLEGLARLTRHEEQGSIVSVDALMPLYPREPEAVRLWRERLARAGTTRG